MLTEFPEVLLYLLAGYGLWILFYEGLFRGKWFPKDKVKVSLLLVVYNQEEVIEGWMRNIINSLDENHIELELLILDKGSSDKTRVIASKLSHYFANFKILEYIGENPTAHAVSLCRGDVICCCDLSQSKDARVIWRLVTALVNDGWKGVKFQ